ncbi:MAG: endonuclease/exonuclease/phosphatase family protein [Limisphaerales bacterium]
MENPTIPPLSPPRPSRGVSGRGLFDVVCLMGVASTGMGFLASSGWFFELASHFRVQLALVLGLLAAGMAFQKRHGASAVLLMGALINGGLVLAVARPQPSPVVSRGVSLRVVSLNVHTSNQEFDRVVSYLRQTEADVIVLLEMDERWARAVEALNDRYPHRVVVAREDNFGIVLLSRKPFVRSQVVDLAGSEVPSIDVTLDVDGVQVPVLGTHPVPPATPVYAAERNRQLASIATWAASHSGKAVVLGDLNTTPWSPYFSRLLVDGRLVRAHPRWGVEPTWMADQPWVSLLLDHVLVSPEIGVTSVEVGPDVGSDHRPVRADLLMPR